MAIAIKYVDAAREAAARRFIESRARKVIADIYTLANTEVLPNSSTRVFFKAWLDRKSLEADSGTHDRYTSIANQFLDQLGRKADSDIKKITPTDVAGFRDAAARRLAVSSANLMLKMLRSIFTTARREGLIDDNPAERVTNLKRQSDFERRPFTLPELKRLHAAERGGSVSFEYDAEWLHRDDTFAIDLTALPLQRGVQHGTTLLGAIQDCGTDRWGRVLIERPAAKKFSHKSPITKLIMCWRWTMRHASVRYASALMPPVHFSRPPVGSYLRWFDSMPFCVPRTRFTVRRKRLLAGGQPGVHRGRVTPCAPSDCQPT